METSLKTGFAQIFSWCPKNLSCPKFGGAASPLAPPPGPYAYDNICQQISEIPGGQCIWNTSNNGSFQSKLSVMSKGTSEIVVLFFSFFGRNVPKGKICSICSNLSLIPVSGLSVQIVNTITRRSLPVWIAFHSIKLWTDRFALVK